MEYRFKYRYSMECDIMKEKKYDVFLSVLGIFIIAFLPFIIGLFLSGVIGFYSGLFFIEILIILSCLETVIHGS